MTDGSGHSSRIAQQLAMWEEDDKAEDEHENLRNCEVCGASIDPDPPDGFTEYARLVGGYIDHFTEEHPDHDLLDAPEAHL